MSRTRWEASFDKRKEMQRAEESGEVADSMEYRTKLMERVHAGELSLEEAQTELKKVKRNAKKNGLVTRSQAFSRG
jgi:uncharacterized protein YaaN involved in tellurite resistance